jgi:hypothetical protein
MKQVTGRQHRDIQRYIVAVIAGVAPPAFIIAIRALQNFQYLAQVVLPRSGLVQFFPKIHEPGIGNNTG